MVVFDTIYTSIFTFLLSFHISLGTKYQPNLFLAVLKTNLKDVIWYMYIQEFFECNVFQTFEQMN